MHTLKKAIKNNKNSIVNKFTDSRHAATKNVALTLGEMHSKVAALRTIIGSVFDEKDGKRNPTIFNSK
jgi:hypothetical protein